MAQTPEHAARVLGLIGEPTLDDVKRARRELALKYHPDRSDDAARATQRMARVNAAADTLIAYLKNKTASCAQRDSSAQKGTENKQKQSRSQHFDQKREATEAPSPKPKPKCERPASSVQSKTASDGARRAWKAERALAVRAAASYRAVLSGIGRSAPRAGIDMQILQFGTSGV